MNNRFINFLEFVTDDPTAQAKNLYHPTQKLRTWEAKDGDSWRLLIKNSVLRGQNLSDIQPRIMQCVETLGVWDNETFSDTERRAVLRKQHCESYTEFVIKINEASTQSAYRQFALTRSNGQTVLGTVRQTATDAESYAAKVQAHFESYPFAKVIVHRKGTLLAVRVYTNKRFYMDDEEVSIGIGRVSEYNTNSPSLAAIFLGTVSYAAQFSFELVIENVEPGNLFELGGISYEAQSGDDAETVKKALLAAAERLVVLQSEVVSPLATKGARTIVNSNTPRIELSYVDTLSSEDRYEVSIGASIVPGNTYQIQATGTALKSYTATASDTIATVKAALTEVSGYYEVPEGTVPEWLAIAGIQRVDNINTPRIYLSDQQSIAAATKDKYRIITGADVQKGNQYFLGETSYIATAGDTAETVGIALGLSGEVDLLEVPENSVLKCYAKVGKRYTDEDICDVSIIQQPRIFKSSHLVLEVDWSDLALDQTYSIQLYNSRTEQVLAYSNLVELVGESPETSLLEVADSFDAVGYEYYEKTTQRIRLPVYLRIPKQRISENRTGLLNGGYRRASTKIEQVRELVTRAENADFHQVLAAWLKHSNVWVDDKAYYCEGEYTEMIISELSQKKQAKAMMVPAEERNNKTTYFATDSKPMRCGGVTLHGFDYGLRILLKTDSFESELQQGSNILSAGEYQILIYNDGDARKIRIAPEGFETVSGVVPGQSKARLRRLVRVESGKELEIYCEKAAAPSVVFEPEAVYGDYEVTEYVAEKETLYLASFNDDFSDDFSN